MHETFDTYIEKLNEQYATGIAHEYAYRTPLQNLLTDLLPKGYTVVNEPTKEKCGKPDYIILKGDIPIAYIETKDLFDNDLDGRRNNREQFDRYKSSLDHIVFTDYLDFHLYENENSECVKAIRLADLKEGKIVLKEESIIMFTQLIDHLAKATPQRITSPVRLAKVMAGKARLLADVIEEALNNDPDEKSELAQQMKVFREMLIHDLDNKAFADIYAQTIAYGLFSARLNDKTPEDFSRFEANTLIPESNPFLRKIFNDIAGFNVDSRIGWIVDDLVEAFRVTDMARVMKGFGESSKRNDPMMHFYEDFLDQYDPQTKARRGVYYTPQPVVDFIVRAVDDILKRDFGLPMGLADSSKIKHEVVNDQYVKAKRGTKEPPKTIHKLMHRVQILDPATGTGTFLAAIIRQIYAHMEGQRGTWSSYVEQHLLPRLNGFELMMASYTIAHLKLNMVLKNTGFVQQSNQRLHVYLTNSLEEYNADTGTLFSAAISQEAADASRIKRDTPVMVMIGNPPYSVSSSNNSNYILRLLNNYKKDLNERNIQPLSDDYIKFIRLGQEYISRTGEGILAFICNNSFIDGIIHRQMRKELMQKFDEIYILDLHGNSRKKETAPDGSKDENVFDIMPGVSINIFVKKLQSDESCKVFHCNLLGNRNSKYSYLETHNLNDVEWIELNPQEPLFFFVPKDFSVQEEYETGFKIEELMGFNTSGVKTHHDKELVAIEPFSTLYNNPYTYRPLDDQWIDYDLSKVVRHRYNKMRHILSKENISLIIGPQGQAVGEMLWNVIFISDKLVDTNIFYRGGGILFPLYLYSEDGSVRVPNFDKEIWGKINAAVGEEVSPEDLFDYIYAVLHSPAYRTKYKEFLKIDFPRIPYPETATEYHRMAAIGAELRQLHLMEKVPDPQYAKFDTPGGNNVVDRLVYKDGNVWINKEKCFANVPETAWNFYIGGYQPAQKWLKDRRGRMLTYDDTTHYRRIITVLLETDRLMNIIDNPSHAE